MILSRDVRGGSVGFPRICGIGADALVGWPRNSFIRGNHDGSAICRRDPRYLGDLKKTRFRCLAELETLKVEFDGDGSFSWRRPAGLTTSGSRGQTFVATVG